MFLLFCVLFQFAILQVAVNFVKLFLVVNAVTLYFSFIFCTLFSFFLHVNVGIVIRSVVEKKINKKR